MLTLATGIILSIVPRLYPHQQKQQLIDSGHTLIVTDSAYCYGRKLIVSHSYYKGGSYIAKLEKGDIIRLSNNCKRIVEDVKKVKTKDYKTDIFKDKTLYLQTCSKKRGHTIIVKATLIQ